MLSPEELKRSFGFLMHDVSRLLRKSFDRHANTIGLTRAQWRVLAHLSRNEGLKQAGLAEILEIKPITLARLLDRLGAHGWVERRSDPRDKRARRLFLSQKGRSIIRELRVVALSVRAEALAGLTDAEQDLLIDQLRVVKENLLSADEAADQVRSFDPEVNS
ncbi:uncharacterized protein METZ01_LOCUS293040 [marine metagenome]|uniref:HTH marR-type domain-containing protein n=1 Tax=marine metagenome TaxID=408172 RepID=A0A382LUG5_9ZZZZ